MPYSPDQTRSLIQSAVLHERMPNSDYIKSIVEQLRGAEEFASKAAEDLRSAKSEVAVLKSQLKIEEERYAESRKKLEEQGDLIQQIAAGAKQAKKLAADFLKPQPTVSAKA